MRKQYTQHLHSLLPHATQLLITFEYDQSLVPGPPFSVNQNEVKTHYPTSELVESQELMGGLKGQWPAVECTWLVRPKQAD